MNRKIEDILDECLDRAFAGDAVEDCLAGHPSEASELKQLLGTSSAVMQSCASILPDPAFKVRAWHYLEAIFHDRFERIKSTGAVPIWRRAWTMAMAGVLVVLLSCVAVLVASTSALPDEHLYPAKLAAEQVRMTLAFTDLDEAKLHLEFAERRAYEMVEVAQQGKADSLLALAGQVAEHLGEVCVTDETKGVMEEAAAALAPAASLSAETEDRDEGADVEDLGALLSQSREENLQALEDALAEAPEALKPILRRTIDSVAKDYDRTISIVQSGSNQ
jgi:hypothetical protein